MRYFLGIDGGASKTKAVIIDEKGKLVSDASGGPVNYHQGGLALASLNLETVIKKVLQQANLNLEKIAFTVLGLAGRDSEEDVRILNRLAENLFGGKLKDKTEVISDLETAFAAAVPGEFGLVLISGGGANCFGKGKNGETARAGDWGYLLGDQGSGFALGQAALRALMKQVDGRGEETLLTKLILEKLGLAKTSQLVDWVYFKKDQVKEVADLAHLVFMACGHEDKVAQKLVKDLIGEMILSIKTVVNKVGLINEAFEIGLVGGVFKEKIAVDLLENEIGKVFPKAKVVLAQKEPALAAALLAKKNL